MTSIEPYQFDMHEIVRLVEAAGHEVFVMHSGGGCQTIYAGAPRKVDDDHDYPVLAGPGSGDVSSIRAVAVKTDFYIGPDAYFHDDIVDQSTISTDDTWTEQMAADEIVRQLVEQAATA